MTTIIKNGTIVTADLTYKADVLIEGGIITAIGPNLKGDDGSGCDRLLHHAGRD
jgi:dihydropyrimidinase